MLVSWVARFANKSADSLPLMPTWALTHVRDHLYALSNWVSIDQQCWTVLEVERGPRIAAIADVQSL